jgi:hypothetical protein
VGLPGLHSELRTIAQILEIPFINLKTIKEKSYGTARSKQEYLGQLAIDYAFGKATPTIGLGKEIFTGEAFPKRPVPWSAEKGTPSQPRMGWAEYGLSHAPILATTPARYFFDQLRKGGMSAFDATAIIKGLIISAIGATGMHAAAEKEPISPEQAKINRAQVRQAAKREKAAQALRNR